MIKDSDHMYHIMYKSKVRMRAAFTVMGQEPDTALTGSRCRSGERQETAPSEEKEEKETAKHRGFSPL